MGLSHPCVINMIFSSCDLQCAKRGSPIFLQFKIVLTFLILNFQKISLCLFCFLSHFRFKLINSGFPFLLPPFKDGHPTFRDQLISIMALGMGIFILTSAKRKLSPLLSNCPHLFLPASTGFLIALPWHKVVRLGF